MIRFVTVLFCGLFIVGCQDRTTTTLGGVHVTVDGTPTAIKVVDDTAHVEVASAKYDLSIQNGRLNINDREYGPVAEGDDVRVSGAGVAINGKLAEPLSDQ